MSDEKVVDFLAQRRLRIHDKNDQRLDEMRKAFEASLPLPKAKKKPNKPSKKR